MISRFSFSLLFAASSLAAFSQTKPGSNDPASRGDSDEGPVEHLDPMVVTGVLESGTAFDAAQGVSILDSRALDRQRAASLGETLSNLPGVSSTYYGPGASRPIVRGFSGDRVKMLSSGLGTQDLSNISPDHAVAVEPSLAERIEILRGPACLLYGNAAVGGVVNVLDGRIPLDETGSSVLAEGRYDTASEGRTGVLEATAGNSTGAFRFQGVRSKSDDVRVPGWGKLFGSSIDTTDGSAGAAVRNDVGVFGFAVNQRESTYGVPVGDEAVAIDLRQRRLDLDGRVEFKDRFIRSLRLRASMSRYKHHEFDFETGEIHTTFKQNGGELRFEAQQEKIGPWTGVSGLQVSGTHNTSVGEEVVAPDSRTKMRSFFTLQELALEGVTLQAGARLENQRIEIGEVRDDLPAFDGYDARSGEVRSSTSPSAAVGAVWYPAKDYSVAFHAVASEREPNAQELFSNGPHGGTGAYEVGRTDLRRERSEGVELTVRRRAGCVTGSVGAFVHRFGNYIYEKRLPDSLTPTENNGDGLPAYQFTGVRAEFVGAEAEIQAHLVEETDRKVHVDLGADWVRATDHSLGAPLPRIPPVRLRVAVSWEQGDWYGRVGATQVLRQDRIATDEETETAGYLMLNAEAGRSWATRHGRFVAFVRGQNLGDRFARVHTSFLKETAPLPGRGAVMGVRYMY